LLGFPNSSPNKHFWDERARRFVRRPHRQFIRGFATFVMHDLAGHKT